MVYAVKIGNEWYIANKAKGSEYRLEPGDKEFWSEARTTALLCAVGDESAVVELGESGPNTGSQP